MWSDCSSVGAVASNAGIPEEILIDRSGLNGNHTAGGDEHVSDMSVAAAERLIEEQGIDPTTLDAVVYFGSTFKDYQAWHVSSFIADRIGAKKAFALELDYTSCGSPVAVRVVRDLIQPGQRHYPTDSCLSVAPAFQYPHEGWPLTLPDS